MSRAGRKRKSTARRTSTGRLARQYVNYRDLAALQPHRRDLPPEYRLSQEATTALGRLFLCGQIGEAPYLAGCEFARRRTAYVATIAAPRQTVGRGGPGCNPSRCYNDPDNCLCNYCAQSYDELRKIVYACGGRVVAVVDRVIAHDQLPDAEELAILAIGLNALAAHLQLTTTHKQSYARNRSSQIM